MNEQAERDATKQMEQEIVDRLLRGEPMTAELLTEMNIVSINAIRDSLREVGYRLEPNEHEHLYFARKDS